MNEPHDDPIDLLLRQHFDGPVPDAGFSDRVMQRLPARRPARWPLWSGAVIGAIAFSLSLATTPLVQAAWRDWLAGHFSPAVGGLWLAMGGVAWLAVGWGLRPLARMAQLLKSRDPDNLAPLLLAPLPQELEPVAASLNRLLQQVNQLIEREKRFIADAAHELRTPLAVLRIHAQNALQAASEEERERALGQHAVGVGVLGDLQGGHGPILPRGGEDRSPGRAQAVGGTSISRRATAKGRIRCMEGGLFDIFIC